MAAPVFTCGGCDNTWTAGGAAHCSGCHRTFSTTATFDKHRAAGRCVIGKLAAGKDGIYRDRPSAGTPWWQKLAA